ncbi:type II secretion system protein J [Chloroflexota bacterium]
MMVKEKGFGLISLAVAIAISAMVAAGAGMTSVHIIKGTERNEAHAEVIRQAHNLGRWFSRDALTAANITAGDDLGTANEEFITIYWKDWESGETCDIRYIWLDYIDSLKQLKRNQVKRDKDGGVTDNTTTLMAYNISSANLSQQDNLWILNVETRSGQKTSVKEYKIMKRLN